jgi:predicted Rossmann fold flavoprotein
MHKFSPEMVYDWFEQHRVPLKCEIDMRVFPVSNQGRDVVRAFEEIFSKNKTEVLFKHTVTAVEKKGDKFLIFFKDQAPLEVDKLVLSLGGQAFRHTGSAGDGYTLAESLGHSITSLAPSLFSFVTKEIWPKNLSGLSLAKVNILVQAHKRQNFTGPFLFTHWGLTGPAIFALSAMIAFENFNKAEPLKIFIDFLPDISVEKLDADLKKILKNNPKKSLKNSLHSLIPLALAEIICQELNIDLEKKNAQISKQELFLVQQFLKRAPLHIIGRGPGDEFVTAGGVDLTEVNPRTMESKICPGLYFAGEILNIDGFTGGFNLQASWATGRAAGEAAAIS